MAIKKVKMSTSSRAWFGKVSVPYRADPEPNDQYWQDKLNEAKDKIAADPALVAVWESDIVPAKATYRDHFELAKKIINGEIKL